MKRHMTHSELVRTRRLIRNGVVDIAEIQTQVFCHADNIQRVLDVEQKPTEVLEVEAPKAGAAAKAAAKKAAAKAAKKVDPIS